jgi:hypothetical protein
MSPAERDCGSIIGALRKPAGPGVVRVAPGELQLALGFAHDALLGGYPGQIGEVAGALAVSHFLPPAGFGSAPSEPLVVLNISFHLQLFDAQACDLRERR